MKQPTISIATNGAIVRCHNTRITIIDEVDTLLFQFRMFKKDFDPTPGQEYHRGVVKTDMRMTRRAARGISGALYEMFKNERATTC